MKDIKNIMPLWGPYSKKYSGISKIANHKTEDGVRFDLVVAPAISNANACPPNVTIPVGVHPWTSKADYSHYSYRVDMEWKDIIYSDVSFTRLTDNSVLVRTEIFNNSELCQNCLVNFFSDIEYPNVFTATAHLPEKNVFIKANDYKEFTYNTSRPWDAETMDAMHKGEFFDDRFTYHRGLGDRDNNRYILPKFSKFGQEKGDIVTYNVKADNFTSPVLSVRYRTTDNKPSDFTLNGKKITFPTADDMGIVTFSIDNTITELNLVSLGTGGIEFDFFCITEKDDAEKICVTYKEHNFVPETKTELFNDGAKSTYKFDGVEEKFILRTFNPETRFREFPTGSLEDSPTPRISQPDPSFHDMLEQFSGSFAEKHSDKGYYHNTVIHTIYINPHESKVEYAVISGGETEYKSVEEYEKIYLCAKASLEKLDYTEAGKKYEFSNQLLRAAMFQNTVYPLYHHGNYVVHHTPGKRWDSFYSWDSGFIGLDMQMLCPEVAEYILDMYLGDKDNKDYAFLLHGSPVPVHIYQYFEMLSHENDKTTLYKYYDRVKMYYDFLSGKINGSTTAKFKSGMTTTFDYFYNCSGMDDLPPQVAMYKREIQKNTAPVISSSQVIRTAKILKIIAQHLGKSDDVITYQSDIDRITKALNTFSWDDECGYYSYVVHDDNGNAKEKLRTENGENLNKTMDGIYPIIAGATDETQQAKILSHLKNHDEMMSPVGISAVNMKAGYYATNGYWNGNVWFSHQWFVWKTMLDLGENDFAFEIAETALKSWKREVEYSYYTFEMMSIVTGRGGWFHNFGGLSAPVNIWASAYYKAGTFNCGFDMFCESHTFNSDNTVFEGQFSHYNQKNSTVLVVMNDGGEKYKITLNGTAADFNEREKGMFEITVPANAEKADIKIQLV